MTEGNQGIELWNRAKALESCALILKRDAWGEITTRFPTLTQKNFGSLSVARKRGKLSAEVAQLVEEFESNISVILNKAKSCREESERLLEEAHNADTRRVLDPAIDSIPHGAYPKLRECKVYPLRHTCNYGESAISRWNRCEHMKYDQSKSIHDPKRWMCTAPNE
jgi:hypothetical protein